MRGMTGTETRAAIELECAALLDDDPLFLDTETTGLGPDDQVVEICVLDVQGRVVFESLVRPTIPIPGEALAVHGIGELEVAESPVAADVLPALARAIEGRTVIVYNAAFDLRMLAQSARACGQEWPLSVEQNAVCAMELYAKYWGDWNEYRHSYRWQKLSDAARQQGIEDLPELHRARADAELTRRLVLAMGRRGARAEEVLGDQVSDYQAL